MDQDEAVVSRDYGAVESQISDLGNASQNLANEAWDDL
jgi:hypothetical protein